MKANLPSMALMAKGVPEKSSSFNVIIQDEFSLSELYNFQKKGFSVIKTPHVGNFYPNNLAIGKLGIKMIVYDRNIGCVDRNFHPHMIIKDGCKHPVASSERLMTHAQANREIESLSLEFGERVADYHISALQKVFPQGNFILYTDYLANYRYLVYSILEEVSNSGLLPRKFSWFRRVDRDGKVIKLDHPARWSDVAAVGIFGVDNKREGYLIPNFLNVFLSGVIEVINSNSDEVYHLSGPDMIRYIDSMTEGLSQCLTFLSSKKSLFPSRISFNLVPVANMRFAVHESRRKSLDDLISAYLRISDHKTKKGEFMKSLNNPEERKAYGPMFKGVEQKLRADLSEAVSGCPEAFYDIYKGDFISQYDIPSNGLYIPRWSLETPVKEINNAFHAMNNLKK